jgi:hypothetical protein
MGVCRQASLAVQVSAPEARACDVVLALGSQGGVNVVFDKAVMGQSFRRGDRLSLSLVARADQPLGGDVAALEPAAAWMQQGPGSWQDRPSVQRFSCYGRAGKPVGGAWVNIR